MPRHQTGSRNWIPFLPDGEVLKPGSPSMRSAYSVLLYEAICFCVKSIIEDLSDEHSRYHATVFRDRACKIPAGMPAERLLRLVDGEG